MRHDFSGRTLIVARGSVQLAVEPSAGSPPYSGWALFDACNLALISYRGFWRPARSAPGGRARQCCSGSLDWPSRRRDGSSRSASLVFIAAAVFGIPVAKSLSPGGFQDPKSESARAIAVLTDKFGQSDQQLLIMVTAPGGTNSEQARDVATDLVDQLQRSPLVYNVSSAWTAPPQAAADLVSTDGKSGLIVVNLKGGENDAQKNAQNPVRQVRPRPRRRHRPRRRLGDGIRADQQAEPRRPAVDGDDRDPAELPGAGLGVRRPAGGGAADGGRRRWPSSARCRCCGSSRSPPTCRSSR